MLCKHCKKELNESQTIGDYKSCPNCSVRSKEQEHIFYLRSFFGNTPKRETPANPDGVHSWCPPCRNNNDGPHDGYIKCSDFDQTATNPHP